jgi:hypothetical protein
MAAFVSQEGLLLLRIVDAYPRPQALPYTQRAGVGQALTAEVYDLAATVPLLTNKTTHSTIRPKKNGSLSPRSGSARLPNLGFDLFPALGHETHQT